jgi:hypothetical protein
MPTVCMSAVIAHDACQAFDAAESTAPNATSGGAACLSPAYYRFMKICGGHGRAIAVHAGEGTHQGPQAADVEYDIRDLLQQRVRKVPTGAPLAAHAPGALVVRSPASVAVGPIISSRPELCRQAGQ